MAGFCPFCGADVEPDKALPGPLPGTVLCPVCGQEQDHQHTAAGSAAPAPTAPAAPTEGGTTPEAHAAGPGHAAPATPPPAPAAAQALTAPLAGPSPGGPSLGGPEDWRRACPEASPEPYAYPGPAWEKGEGLFGRLLRTTWQVLGHPGHTLGAPARPELGWSLGYGLILGTFSTAMTLLWGLLALGRPAMSSRAALWALLLSPLLNLAELFVKAGLIHLMLFILGGARKGIFASFRVVAYAEAAGLLTVLPFLGTAAQMIWQVVILTAGLAASHGIGKGRAFTALILPPLLLVLLALLAAAALGLTALLAVLGELSKSPSGLGL